ncbi:hypothetical protein R1flu_017677 [Riccia fluitans]|uniref:Bifunctional inhibitor/plant lipid transfer protein/seed storage helical domain-containing protein n=1 Tax=Riccia fluitans TaxID=41844 RepID=A0ABD1ZHN5_9MARC
MRFITEADESGTDKPDCSAQVVELAPCLAFVSGQDIKPPETCCEALKSVLVDTPSCLCEIIGSKGNGTAHSGLPSVNLTLVKVLPKECNVQQQEKTDESRCPGHGNSTPGTKSGSVKSAFAPSVLGSLIWAIFIFVASEFQHSAKFYSASHREYYWDG